MRNRLWTAVVLVAAVTPATAQTPGTHQVSMKYTYYVCVKPTKEPPCFAWDEASKKNCSDCEQWEEKTMTHVAQLKLRGDAYAYVDGPPRANTMANDASLQLFHVGLPKVDGATVTASTLYKNADELGWVEVGEHSPKTGAIAVWPGVTGVVVADTSGGSQDLSKVQVLYPSDLRKGELVVRPASDLTKDAAPRFVVPEAALNEMKANVKPKR